MNKRPTTAEVVLQFLSQYPGVKMGAIVHHTTSFTGCKPAIVYVTVSHLLRISKKIRVEGEPRHYRYRLTTDVGNSSDQHAKAIAVQPDNTIAQPPIQFQQVTQHDTNTNSRNRFDSGKDSHGCCKEDRASTRD